MRLAEPAQVLLAKARLRLKTQTLAQLRVIAPLRMGVQRQVVCEQVNVMGQQQSQALTQPAGHPPVVAAPEQTMVHKNRIGILSNGCLDQRQAGGDARHQFAHRAPPLHLQAIGPIVFEALGLQHGVKSRKQGKVFGHGLAHRVGSRAAGAL